MNRVRFGWLAAGSVLLLSVSACSSSGDDTGAAGDAGPSATADAGTGPITLAAPNTWTWAGVDNAFCRDGSPTGIAVSKGAQADKLMIFLEGGGACFNSATCLLNPPSFDAAGWLAGTGLATKNDAGIFDRTNAANPVKDWSFVYVPYCTGDTHVGNNPAGLPDGETTPQKFVGYQNVTEDLKRITSTFSGLSKVLLTGISAGGFGAAGNYVQVASAFPNVPVYLLDDSGPPMEDPYLAKCLQQKQVALWGLDKTILAACGSSCPQQDNYLIDYSNFIGTKYPNIPSGFIDSVNDNTISQFFGFGLDNCSSTSLIPTPLPPATYEAGIEDLRTKLAGNAKFGSFIFGGAEHTSLGTASFYTRVTNAANGDTDAGAATEADGGSAKVKLVDWVTTLVNSGTVSNVGP